MLKTFTSLFLFIAISHNLLSQDQFIPDQGTKAKHAFQPMNGNGTLGVSVYDSACGLNYVQASQLVETRSVAAGFNTNGTGLPTTLAINGLSPSFTIRTAYVWYTAAIQALPSPNTSVIITNPASVSNTYPATIIGTSGAACWGEAGTAVYRADVTANIAGSGAYNIDISGFANKNWEVDGVTLMIIYQDAAATYQGSLMIWDGSNTCTTGGCSLTQSMTGFSVCTNSISGNAFLVVSDMQTASISPPEHASTLNGTTVNNFPNDFYNFDTVNTSVTAGQTTSAFGTAAINGSDCFSWSLMGLYYQTNCASCCTSLVATATSVSTSCATGLGSASAVTNCGTAPYTYLWSNGQTDQTATGLAVGNYTVTVTDSTAAISTATVSVINNPFNATLASTPVLCFGGTSGTATVTVSGGTAPYAYAWNPGGQTTNMVTGLHTGTYSVVISDAGGCVDTFAVSVPGAPMLSININATPSSCFNCPDGSGSSNVLGGKAPYGYMWSNGKITPNVTGLYPGTYTLCVTDANGCKTCDSISVAALGVNELYADISIVVSPNPFHEFTVLQITSAGIGNYELKIFDLFGKEVDAAVVRDQNKFTIHRNDLSQGVYFYKVIAKDGRYAAGKLIVE